MAVTFFFDSAKARDDAEKALRDGGKLLVKIDWGKYQGSVGAIASRDLYYPSYLFSYGPKGSKRVNFTLRGGICRLVLANGKYVRLDGTNCNKVIRALSPRAKMLYREAKPVSHPESFIDRHGQELRIGSNVLVSLQYKFVFGRIEKLTEKWITVRRGKMRTKLPNQATYRKAIVKLDRSIADRFMLEKLSNM